MDIMEQLKQAKIKSSEEQEHLQVGSGEGEEWSIHHQRQEVLQQGVRSDVPDSRLHCQQAPSACDGRPRRTANRQQIRCSKKEGPAQPGRDQG